MQNTVSFFSPFYTTDIYLHPLKMSESLNQEVQKETNGMKQVKVNNFLKMDIF